ncbi:MAG: adenylosuccinate synthetase, partial [Actinomycetota bacterium]|nr:adenylosuccinate synthetase [Actinomycetota bacterium]
VRQAARLNSLSEIALTKLDVLDGFETVKVCVGYRDGDEFLDSVPYHQSVFHRVQPIYEELEGWMTPLSACTSPSQLPSAARRYIEFLESAVGVKIATVGVGPSRDQFVSLP